MKAEQNQPARSQPERSRAAPEPFVPQEDPRRRAGEAIVWDDSFEHEVVVDGEEATAPPRAIVIVHFEHPDLVKQRFPRSNAALIAAAQRAPGEWNPVCDHAP